MDLNDHPSVIAYRRATRKTKPEKVSGEWLKKIVCEAGADDVGLVDIDHPALQEWKPSILAAFPKARTLVSFVCRMNPAQIRSPDRSLADGEFIEVDAEIPRISRKVVRALREKRIEAVAPSAAFPQNMDRWPERILTISHKPVAEAAGLGRIGHHRLLIHPEFGSHICLGTLIMDTAPDSYSPPLDFDPCISCNLCVSVCPTGAIGKDGSFRFRQCLVHAYRDRLGGFLGWVEALVSSESMAAYREKRSDGETLAVWQSLTYGGGYRCGYCMSVCPAGSDVIGPYIEDRKAYITAHVKPLQDREENVYVLPGPESGTSLSVRFPRKTARQV